jgi:A/G-specific adenine glycosylase
MTATRLAERRPRPTRAAAADTGAVALRPIAAPLLAWYDQAHRDLPWRYGPGETPDPYRVWLSEVMLQQTTVKAVIPHFQAFLKRWPTVRALAKARRDDVMAAWAGLGYYSRARNLHDCAKAVVARHKGNFPSEEAALLDLPGIGPYTAAAIAAIAFGRKATPVDGNVERVVARLFAVEAPLPGAKPELRALAATVTPAARAGDFAQAMMDLGALVCTPRRPSCLMCPLASQCRARAAGIEATLPRRAARRERPIRRTIAFVVLREDGAVLLRRRPDAGLLGGMLEVPSTPWVEDAPGEEAALGMAPVLGSWWRVPGQVSHVFTHFRLDAEVRKVLVGVDTTLDLWAEPERCIWVKRRELERQALPSVMRKILAHALQ